MAGALPTRRDLSPSTAGTVTVFTTTTIISTITFPTGIPRTIIITSTETEILTIINEDQQTQTNIVTMTYVVNKAKRTAPFGPITTALPAADVEAQLLLNSTAESPLQLNKRNTPTVYLTITLNSVVTVFAPGIVTSTFPETVFATVTLAPNAATTVFSTTTAPERDHESSTPRTMSTLPSPNPSLASTLQHSTPPPSSSATSSLPLSLSRTIDSLSTNSGLFSSTHSNISPSETITAVSSSSHLSAAQIAAIVPGVVLGVFLLIILAFALRSLARRQQRRHLELSPASVVSVAASTSGGDLAGRGEMGTASRPTSSTPLVRSLVLPNGFNVGEAITTTQPALHKYDVRGEDLRGPSAGFRTMSSPSEIPGVGFSGRGIDNGLQLSASLGIGEAI